MKRLLLPEFTVILLFIVIAGCTFITPPDETKRMQSLEYVSKGIDFLQDNNYSEARASFELSAMLYPNAAAFDGLGCVEAAKGNYEDALLLFGRALKTNPEYFHAYGNMAYVFLMKGDYEQALDSYRMALLDAPDNQRFRYNRAATLYRQPEAVDIDKIMAELYRAKVISESRKVEYTIDSLEKIHEKARADSSLHGTDKRNRERAAAAN